MANFKYFSDTAAETIELKNIQGMKNAEFVSKFPLVKGKRHDGYSMMVGYPVDEVAIFDRTAQRWLHTVLPVTRVIEYKANPSKHVCDSRCMHATGKVMKCECSCGGKNHGRGEVTD